MTIKQWLILAGWFGLVSGTVSAQSADSLTTPKPMLPPIGAPSAPAATPGKMPSMMPGEMLPPSSTDVLTAPPGQSAYPAGTVTSPWTGNGSPGCCGPVGGHGPLTYELYSYTGPSLVVGGSELSSRLKTGWGIGTGVRTLLFNTEGTRAWAFDLGLNYIYNRGQSDGTFFVATPRVDSSNPNNPIRLSDGIAEYTVRGLHRTRLTFGFGRDWWLRGPGLVNTERGRNFRFGTDIGGSYATSHVDLVPVIDPTNYLRRQNVVHGVYIGANVNYEIPVGSWIFFTGLRTQWDYTMTNLVPPQGADVHSVNLFFQAGFRF